MWILIFTNKRGLTFVSVIVWFHTCAICYFVFSIKVWLQKKIYQNQENLSKVSEFLVELKCIKFGAPGHFQNLLVDSFLSSETWDLCRWLKEVPVCSSFSTLSVTALSPSYSWWAKLKYPDIRGHHLQLVEQSGASWISRLDIAVLHRLWQYLLVITLSNLATKK